MLSFDPLTVRPTGVTRKLTVLVDGPARLYRFDGPRTAKSAPVLLVPSLINRWYIFDLQPGYSVVEALVNAGLDVWLLDWGTWRDEDRFFSWDDLHARLFRFARRVRRETKEPKLTLLGYSMGAIAAAIATALEPQHVSGLVSLMGPFDFSRAGHFAQIADAAWFDADAIADAGNLSGQQMSAGFSMLRPTAQLARMIGLADPALDPLLKPALLALEAWVADHVAFPAEAYRRYIKELYQQNQLVRGEHRVLGQRVDLRQIICPLLSVSSPTDAFCPPEAALGLNRAVGSSQASALQVPGGHVASVVGGTAPSSLYPKLVQFMTERPCSSKI